MAWTPMDPYGLDPYGPLWLGPLWTPMEDALDPYGSTCHTVWGPRAGIMIFIHEMYLHKCHVYNFRSNLRVCSRLQAAVSVEDPGPK